MNKKRILILAVVGVIAIIAFWQLINKTLYKSRASGETVTVSFAPSSGTLTKDVQNTAELLLTVPTGKGIAGVDVTVQATNIKITSLSNVTPIGNPAASEFTEITSDIEDDGSSASKASVVIAGDDKLASSARISVTYTCLQDGEAKLAVDKSKLEVVGNIDGNTFAQGLISDAVFNCSSTGGGTVVTPPPSGPQINAQIIPSSQTAAIGGDLPLWVVFNGAPTDKGVSAVDVKLKFDPSLVQVSTIGELKKYTSGFGSTQGLLPQASCSSDTDCKICADVTGTVCKYGSCTNGGCAYNGGVNTVPPTPINVVPTTPVAPTQAPESQTNCTQLVSKYDNTAGTVHVSYVCIMSADKLPKEAFIPVWFKAKAQGTGSLSFTSAKVTGNIEEDSYYVKTANGSYTILGSGGGGNTTPTPAPTGFAGQVKLNLKLRFQGIVSKPDSKFNSLIVKCSIGDATHITPQVKTATFTADEKGIWSGTLAFDADILPGAGKKIFCKGPKHLQKKICNNVPTETFPGTYSPNCDKDSITLTSGDNNLDFSGITLLAGDLPNQDGIVNAYDTSLVINLLDKEDVESVRVADLNLDGKVGAIDHSIVIAALSIRHDEN